MNRPTPVRYCSCGTRLAQDNQDDRCAACVTRARDLTDRPPIVPAGFWQTDRMRDALASEHMGAVIAAYREHPHHGRVLRQSTVAGWMRLSQAQLSRLEHGGPIKDLDKLAQWARTLDIPAHLRWFRTAPSSPATLSATAAGRPPLEADEMHRRDLLRLTSIAAAVFTTAGTDGSLDWDRLAGATQRPGTLDPITLGQYTELNTLLWQQFAAATSKATLYPAVRDQLAILTAHVQAVSGDATYRQVCRLIAELFQLAGEIVFDAGQSTDAAHCYTLAATASREADAFDLWACALTRHAYLSMFDAHHDEAVPMLDLAGRLAQRGDSTLSTRYWVSTVRAQALAGCGDVEATAAALDRAENVRGLTGPVLRKFFPPLCRKDGRGTVE